MAKGSREVRFITLKDWFGMKQAGMLDIEQVKQFVEKTGHRIYESELDKFSLSFPEINKDEFHQFLLDAQALKRAGRKAPVGSGRERTIKINSLNKAVQVGVSAENYDEYVLLLQTIYTAKARLSEICVNGIVSFAIPVKKDKKVSATAE